jgi:hypothetical protein
MKLTLFEHPGGDRGGRRYYRLARAHRRHRQAYASVVGLEASIIIVVTFG